MVRRTAHTGGKSKKAQDDLLAEADIPSWFEARRDIIIAEGKPVPTAKTFESLGMGAGTHLLKMITARADISQSVLRAARRGANKTPPFHASVDVKLFAPAGILLDRLHVRGHPPRRLVDHLTSPDDLSPKVCVAFASAFGQDALDALRAALQPKTLPITRLPAAEFPIVFVPRPGGGDLQITPLAPAEAHVSFRQVTEPFFDDAEEGRPSPRRGRWHRQTLSGKSQNIGYAIPASRRRFRATMPDVMVREEAELHAYLQGGPFPRWWDPDVSEAVLGYDKLLERTGAYGNVTEPYSNAAIRAGLAARADALIHGARAFRAEILSEARHRLDGAEPPSSSSEAEIIFRRRWKSDERDRARRALSSGHFRDRVREVR